MNSKLALLLQSADFPIDYVNFETGLMVHPSGEVLTFVWLEYEDYYHVYLNLCDEEEPYRDILIDGTGATLEEAQDNAVESFDNLLCVH